MKSILLSLLVIAIIAATAIWIRHGGGHPYPNLVKTAQISANALEEVLYYKEPIGNVAVNKDGRVFFTVHPESRTQGNKLLEYVDGASVPYPSLAQQSDLFDTPLGVAIDRLNRLWVIDHGNHGMRNARIVAIDLDSGDVLRSQDLGESIAPAGSLLQDLQITADGETVIIADASYWLMKPALIVYDVRTGVARRVLESDKSVSAEDYVIRSQGKEMEFLGGIVVLRGGVDGIAISEDWLYYGALNGSTLYRVPLRDLKNTALPESQLSMQVEAVSNKPLSDGFSADVDGNVYITDVEHNAIFKVDPSGELHTVLRSKKIRWPDALSFGPDGYLYVADSALPELILQSTEHIRAAGPYGVFRFQPGHEGVPGH